MSVGRQVFAFDLDVLAVDQARRNYVCVPIPYVDVLHIRPIIGASTNDSCVLEVDPGQILEISDGISFGGTPAGQF